jgi:hypothetical protein
LIYQTIISLVSAGCLHFIVRKILAGRNHGNEIAGLSSAVWFSSCWAVFQSTNFLETGTYVLFILLSLAYFLKAGFPKYDFTVYAGIKLGILLGVTFLCRNDAVFMVLGIFLFLFIKSALHDQKQFVPTFKRLLVVGMAFTAVASPWLIYNQLYFGSIVPTSGQIVKEADVVLNLRVFAKAIFENVLLPVPNDYDFNKPALFVVSVYLLLLVGIAATIIKAKHFSKQEKDMLLLMSFFFVFLSAYYVFLSTSYYFFSRYAFIFSPLFTVIIISFIYGMLITFRVEYVLTPIVIVLFFSFALMNGRLYNLRTDNGHTHPADWVRENVPAHVLVGAFQSGTIGYFHDNTINLDGVVNQYALKAIQYDLKHNLIPDKQEQSHWCKYLYDQDVTYLVDWTAFLLDFSEKDPKSAIKGYELIHMAEGFAVLERDKKALQFKEGGLQNSGTIPAAS